MSVLYCSTLKAINSCFTGMVNDNLLIRTIIPRSEVSVCLSVHLSVCPVLFYTEAINSCFTGMVNDNLLIRTIIPRSEVSVCLSVHLSVHLSVCLSVCPVLFYTEAINSCFTGMVNDNLLIRTILPRSEVSVCLSGCVSVCLSICLPIHLCAPVCLKAVYGTSYNNFVFLWFDKMDRKSHFHSKDLD